ncbi:ComK protein [Carnobacterium alterfunditum]|uniref:ComK protein n=1 Tax=Carnobacterium alterfunditum TaxID=28230 RepID=A0A1N6HCL5_9LACT|nr:competence protein ComK [Carnobacterium alterfunditum]SIO17522.1 ComK protein [Carnobacterium alterfunditum]
MKDYFIQDNCFFNKMTWNREVEDIICNLLEELQHQRENRLQEDYFEEEELVDTIMTDITEKMSATTNTIEEWLKRSIEQNQILLDYHTFYVMDISHHSSTPFNTIVFQSNLYPLKTKETSKDLMQRFIDHKGVPYEKIRLIGQSMGFHYKIPYVLGELVFIPEKSSLKGTSSWFSLHHVSRYEVVEQSNTIRLYFKNQSNISVMTKRTCFLSQARKGTALSFCQKLFAEEMILDKNTGQNLFYFKETGLFLNQIDQLTLRRYALFIRSQCNDLKTIIKKQSLTALLGEEHPSLNDILLTFSNE